MIQTQLLNLEAPYQIISYGGEVALHVATLIVCFFIGIVIRMHVITDVNVQTVDVLFAFEEYYNNKQTVKAKLGDKKITDDQKVILGSFEGLLKKHMA